MEYIAFIYKDGDSFVATTPDLNNTSSFGDTKEEAIANLQEACELYCEDLKELPKANTLKDLEKTQNIGKNVDYEILKIDK